MAKEWLRRRFSVLRETLLPFQTISGLGWLFAVLLGSSFELPLKVFSNWTVVPALIALAAARASGMCWNRLIDATLDEKNPRTATRALPSGKAAPEEMAIYALFFLATFLLTCFFFSRPCRILAVIVSSLILFYSFAKRITIGCHFLLGAIYGCIPLAASLWVQDRMTVLSWSLALAAFASVSGTDILYSIQDIRFDRKLRLHSIPARFGMMRSLEIAFLLHLLSIISASFGFWWIGISELSWVIWGGAVAFSFWMWRQLWDFPDTAFQGLFSLFLSFHALSVCASLAVDRLCRVLTP